ncbi:MAG TPA: hypothetical protein VGK90_02795 [Rhizomicrobium sp.]|jgi:hypothetical protein
MRIGLMVVMISVAASVPGMLLADPDSSAPASQPAATAQVVPAQPAATAQGTTATTQVGEHVTVQTSANDNSNVNLDEIVCRNSAPATGTRLGGGRECHTVRQWNDRQRQDQRMLQQQQSVGMVGGK